jgi:hypothetical protein
LLKENHGREAEYESFVDSRLLIYGPEKQIAVVMIAGWQMTDGRIFN